MASGVDTKWLSAHALAEMREQDERNGINPQAFDRNPPPTLTRPPPPPIPPPDWEAERIEAHRRARALQPVREVDPPPVEDTTTTPARPKQKSRTPRLDAVKRLLTNDRPRAKPIAGGEIPPPPWAANPDDASAA